MGKGKRKPLRAGQDCVKSARRSEDDESKGTRELDGSDNDSSSESDGEIILSKKEGQESLDVTFEFNDMKEEYSYGIAKMLQFLIAHPRDAQDAAAIVAAQEEVGTAILCEEGEDVFGYATILPLVTVQESSSPLKNVLEDLLACVTAMGGSGEGIADMRRALVDTVSDTGVFLHGRYVNLPVELVPHLHRNLLDDVAWARSNDNPEPNSAFRELSTCLLLAPVSLATGQRAPIKGQCINITGSSSAVMFDHFENDIFSQESKCSLLFKPAYGPAEGLCVAALIPVSVMRSTCLSSITQLIP